MLLDSNFFWSYNFWPFDSTGFGVKITNSSRRKLAATGSCCWASTCCQSAKISLSAGVSEIIWRSSTEHWPLKLMKNWNVRTWYFVFCILYFVFCILYFAPFLAPPRVSRESCVMCESWVSRIPDSSQLRYLHLKRCGISYVVINLFCSLLTIDSYVHSKWYLCTASWMVFANIVNIHRISLTGLEPIMPSPVSLVATVRCRE